MAVDLEQTAFHEDPTETDDVVRVHATEGWASFGLGDLWRYRELLYFLAWRDIKVRYKQTALGAAWAILQPVMTMVVFTIFFGHLAKLPSEGLPYPLFSLGGLALWTFFSTAMTQASNSLVSSSALISKVYFPRLVIPIGAVLGGLVDLMLATAVLLAVMLGYGYTPSFRALWAPVFALIAVGAALGIGLLLSALNVRYRDVRYVIPFLLQFMLIATPLIYPSTLLHGIWSTVYGLNPMVGAVEGFRWALLGAQTSPGPQTALSVAMTLILLVAGALYFRRTERSFADLV